MSSGGIGSNPTAQQLTSSAPPLPARGGTSGATPARPAQPGGGPAASSWAQAGRTAGQTARLARPIGTHHAGVISAATPTGTISLTNPASGKPMNIDQKILSPALQKQFQSDPAGFARQLQGKINRGHQILQGNLPPAGKHELSTMTDVMWAAHTMAEDKVGTSWEKGAVTIPDPGGKIRACLDQVTGAYQRACSHLADAQKIPGNAPRGIDVPGKSLDTSLPHQMETLLYVGIPKSGELHTTEDRLMLKIEEHGVQCPPKYGFDPNGPMGEKKSFVQKLKGFKSTLGHGVGFAQSQFRKMTGKNSAPGTFKEHIPKDVEKSFQQLLERAPANIRHNLEEGFKADAKPGAGKNDTFGIKGMYRNALRAMEDHNFAVDVRNNDPAAIAKLQNTPSSSQDVQSAYLVDNQFVNDLNFFCMGLTNQYDNLELRHGEEVILTASDF